MRDKFGLRIASTDLFRTHYLKLAMKDWLNFDKWKMRGRRAFLVEGTLCTCIVLGKLRFNIYIYFCYAYCVPALQNTFIQWVIKEYHYDIVIRRLPRPFSLWIAYNHMGKSDYLRYSSLGWSWLRWWAWKAVSWINGWWYDYLRVL